MVTLAFLEHYTLSTLPTVCDIAANLNQVLQLNIHDLYKYMHHDPNAAIIVQPPNQHFLLSAKMNGTQSRILVSP